MRRGSVNTMSEAISSDGIATNIRLTRYLFSTRDPLAVEPRRRHSAADVVAEIRRVILQRAVPHRDVDLRRRRHVVLLLGEIALDVEDHLAALGHVERTPLPHQ